MRCVRGDGHERQDHDLPDDRADAARRERRWRPMANRSGSNLERGIAADLCANAALTGKPRRRCGRHRVRRGGLQARLRRDTAGGRGGHERVPRPAGPLRRGHAHAGEHTHRPGAGASARSVCLNADDSLVASLAPDAPDRVRFLRHRRPRWATGSGRLRRAQVHSLRRGVRVRHSTPTRTWAASAARSAATPARSRTWPSWAWTR